MPTIIILSGNKNTGKTLVLRELATLLLKTYPNHTMLNLSFPEVGDIELVIEINGTRYGILSEGDNKQKMLNAFANKHYCDVLICASRSTELIHYSLRNFEMSDNYEKIWLNTYELSSLFFDSVTMINKLKAKHILELIQKLRLIYLPVMFTKS